MIITPDIIDSDDDVYAKDFERRQRAIIDLWTRVESGSFENTNHNADRPEADDIEDPPDDIDSSEDNDESDRSERVVADDDDDDWAPFSSLEVRLSRTIFVVLSLIELHFFSN